MHVGDALPDFRQFLSDLEGQFPPSRPGDAESEAEHEAEAMKALLTDRGVPVKLARQVARVECGHAPQRTRALECAIGWWTLEEGERGRDILVLAGDRGRGKSYAAAQVIARSKPGSHAIWTSARRLVDLLHNRGDMRAVGQLGRFQQGDLAVLDDLGWEHLDRGGYALSAFIGMLDDRIQQERRTVVTTNLTEQQFRERYGDAIHDRVRGYGVWTDVPSGASMR